MAFIISGFSDEIDSDIDAQFKALNSFGIEYFEPRGINEKNISALSSNEIEQLIEKMKKYNIKASSIGSPIGKIGIDDDFDSNCETLRTLCDTAHKLGTEYMRVFSFYVPQGEAEKHREKVIEQMGAMTDIATREGIILLHENEKDIYGDSPERCLDVLNSINSRNLRAVFDPANFVQCGVQDVSAAWDLLSEYVVYMHIKDSTRDGIIVPSGEGEGQIEYILKKLKANGYNGFLSLEPHLGNFAGLNALEKSDTMTKLEKSSAKTFKIAHNALLEIIERI